MGNKCIAERKGCKATAKPSIGRHLQTFKLKVKRVGKKLFEDSAKLFKPCATKGYALKRLGIVNHFAALGMVVKMTKEQKAHVDKEVLRAKGSKIKDLQEELEGKRSTVACELKLKHKVSWSKGIRRMPEDFENFKPAELLQTNKDFKATTKRSRSKGQTPRAASKKVVPAPPQSDRVGLVLAARGTKRKLCTTTQQELPALKLKAGMLSAKLRDRFGHLCTE